MQVSVENTGTLGRRLTITLPADPIEKEIEQRLKKAAASASLKGFRPGKAPLKLIKETYEGTIRFEVIDEKMRQGLRQALEDQQLTPAGMPQVNLTKINPGEPLEFTAEIEVFPQFTLNTLAGASIEKIIPQVRDEDLADTIDAIRKQHMHFEKVDRPAQENDEVIIDFIGKVDGAPLENGTGESIPLVLGSNRFITGFEAGLVGAKAGDEVTLNLTFPADYHHKAIAGKPVEFAVKVKEVHKPCLPELTDAFLEKFNMKDNRVETFHAEIRANMEREVAQVAKSKLKQAVFNKLAEINQIELPKALVEAEIDALQKSMTKEMQEQYKGKALPTLPREIFTERAKQRVKLGLLLKAAHDLFQITVDDKLLHAAVEQFAAIYANPAEAAAWIYGNKEKLSEIEALTLEDQLVEKLLADAQVVEKPETYPHLMKQHQTHDDHEHTHEHGPDCNHDHA